MCSTPYQSVSSEENRNCSRYFQQRRILFRELGTKCVSRSGWATQRQGTLKTRGSCCHWGSRARRLDSPLTLLETQPLQREGLVPAACPGSPVPTLESSCRQGCWIHRHHWRILPPPGPGQRSTTSSCLLFHFHYSDWNSYLKPSPQRILRKWFQSSCKQKTAGKRGVVAEY